MPKSRTAEMQASDQPSSEPERRYMPGLDGLRALAVLAVIFYHLNYGWAPGGFLGVAVFFVLSGYLITDLLAAEWREAGRIDLKRFWVRRFRRLVPALVVLLAAAAVWEAAFEQPGLTALMQNALSALLYVNNWWLIVHQVSYFESFGPASPVGHLWSLSVEEQFYLLWPFLLLAGFRFIRRRGLLLAAIVLLAAGSAVLMAGLYQPGSDPSRVYYGTDTRAFGLLIGAALAVVWPSRRLGSTVSAGVRKTVDAVGTAGLLAVLLMMWRIDEYNDFLYRGGFVVLSVCTAAAVAAIAHPASRLGAFMSWKPLRWIGERSYGIYLWHYTVIVATSPAVNTNGVNVPLSLLQIAVSFGLAALSYRYIERPIRNGALKGLRRRMTAAWRGARPAAKGKMTYASALCLLMICLIGAACKDSTSPAQAASNPQTPVMSGDGQQAAGEPAARNGQPGSGELPAQSDAADQPGGGETPAQSGGAGQPGSGATPAQSGAAGASPGSAQAGTGAPRQGRDGGPNQGAAGTGAAGKPAAKAGEGVTAIGDSVLLGVSKQLEKRLPGIVVDAKVGRQMTQAADELTRLKAEGKLGSRVIIELGTNGPFAKKQLVKLLDALKSADRVLLVNTRVPRKWQDDVNKSLKSAAADYPNVKLVDWYAASKGHDAFFTRDGVHLQTDGAKFYAAMLADALQQE
ncbi:acyltransferase family protein [Paenibacillus humicola]|uniref:acyltransferase family protein n=1 Tax=Paenibacillus humicola TaxID=3110540 RepID=UPI0030846CFD